MNYAADSVDIDCSAKEWISLVEELLFRHKSVLVRLKGASMLPTISDGERVLIVVPQRPVCRNDIVLYKDRCGQPYVHRIIGIKSDGTDRVFLVRGDCSWYGGDLVVEKDILGMVKAVRRDQKMVAVETLRWWVAVLALRRLQRLFVNCFQRVCISGKNGKAVV